MCLLVFAWDCHPNYRFLFAGNRDEFHARPARAAQWWKDRDLLAGKDEQAGGTWLGLHRDGRFGVVTNFREMIARREDLRSRGELITDYMSNTDTFHGELHDRREQYAGYNLITGDLTRGPLRYHSNRGQTGPIRPGMHGLSNHYLDTPWPKVKQALSGLEALSNQPAITTAALVDLLSSRQPAPLTHLPDTGIGSKREQMLSPAFIVSPEYGTRCSTAIVLGRNNSVEFLERRFDPDGNPTGESRFEFQLEAAVR